MQELLALLAEQVDGWRQRFIGFHKHGGGLPAIALSHRTTISTARDTSPIPRGGNKTRNEKKAINSREDYQLSSGDREALASELDRRE